MEKILKLCEELARAAGAAILEIYATDFDVEYKADQSPLTLADKRANDIIVRGLRAVCPDYGILSEESEADAGTIDKEYCFIVDPLDGTKEFVRKNGQFTVNIALAKNGKSVLGVVYAPVTGDMYCGIIGKGAQKNGVPIHVTNKTNDIRVVQSLSHASDRETAIFERHKEQIIETIRAGSSLKGCLIAEGRADVYYRFGLTCEWDTAAMQCVVEAAGGIVRRLDGGDLRYNRENHLNEGGFYVVNRSENIWV